MKEEKLALHDPIVALATPFGKSAIAVIRTSGEGVIERLDRIFQGKKPLSRHEGRTLAHGGLVDAAGGEKVDEILAAVYRAPHSYSGEDAVEIFCHGGIPTIVRIMELVRRQGFRDASPGEFTLRAFANGKMDLTRAEAVNDIVNAESDRARALALARLSGVLFIGLEEMKKKLVEVLAAVEVMIDYPDETDEHASVSTTILEEVRLKITALLATYQAGKTFQEGAVVAIAGRTNAGKSTLFNLFLKQDRSIVSDFHGTTRDFIEAAVTIGGIPVRLFDTAGLRASDHPVEQEGVRRTRQVLKGASAIIYLVDATVGPTKEDEMNLSGDSFGGRIIRVWNKVDCGSSPAPEGFLGFSAVTQQGFAELEKAIRTTLVGDFPSEGEAVAIDSLRQKEALEAALAALLQAQAGIMQGSSYDLVAADVREAIASLGLVTGEVTNADILEIMFSRFCVGK